MVTRWWNKKLPNSSKSWLKRRRSIFYLKSDIWSKWPQKVLRYLGYLLKQNYHRDFSKIWSHWSPETSFSSRLPSPQRPQSRTDERRRQEPRRPSGWRTWSSTTAAGKRKDWPLTMLVESNLHGILLRHHHHLRRTRNRQTLRSEPKYWDSLNKNLSRMAWTYNGKLTIAVEGAWPPQRPKHRSTK